MNRQLAITIPVIMLLCLTSCSSKGTVEKSPSSNVKSPPSSVKNPPSNVDVAAKLTKQEVAVLAKSEVSRKGYNIDEYESPEISYLEKERRWWVSYRTKKKIPGGSFGFSISDETKECDASWLVE
jgi:hypothetical protein